MQTAMDNWICLIKCVRQCFTFYTWIHSVAQTELFKFKHIVAFNYIENYTVVIYQNIEFVVFLTG